MPTKVWIGGTTAVAQVNTQTVGGTWATSETLTTQLTAEDGTTSQTVVTTVTGATPSVTDVRDQHLADLQASNQTLFKKITWASSGSAAITATAATAGVPFNIGVSETSPTGTYVSASTTANAGPNDWKTAANWSPSGVPVSDDIVKFTHGSFDVLYGLDNRSGVPVDLQSLRISEGYKGSIGDLGNNYFLQIDVSNTLSATPYVNIATGGHWVLLEGATDTVYISRTSRSSSAVKLGGNSVINDIRIVGPNVVGTVTIGSGMDLDNVRIQDCISAKVVMESGMTSLDSIVIKDAGQVEISSMLASNGTGEFIVDGGIVRLKDNFVAGTGGSTIILEVWSGDFFFVGDGTDSTNTLDRLTVNGGQVDFGKEIAAPNMTITNAVIWGGTYTDRGGQANMIYTNDIIQHGGQVTSDFGAVIAQSF